MHWLPTLVHPFVICRKPSGDSAVNKLSNVCYQLTVYNGYSLLTVHVVGHNVKQQACSQPSDKGPGGGSFSSDYGPISGFENWRSQWLSRGKIINLLATWF